MGEVKGEDEMEAPEHMPMSYQPQKSSPHNMKLLDVTKEIEKLKMLKG